jgi:hypothetical protein
MRNFEKQRNSIWSILNVWRYELVLVIFALLTVSTIRGWATVRAYEINYQMCQSNVEEIRELYNIKNN